MIDLTTPLLGPVDLTEAQLVAYFRGGAYDDGIVTRFARALLSATGMAGLRTSIVAGQIAHETARFRFGGQVRPEQHNLAGLGATNDGAAGASFVTIEAGTYAVCAHHLAYRFGPVANWPWACRGWLQLDLRYRDVLDSGAAGKVVTVGDYTNGRWAWSPNVPAGSLDNGYAAAIVRAANDLLATPGGPVPREVGGKEAQQVVKIALSAGHHNRQGGDAEEIRETGLMTPAAAAACRALGMQVTVLTPDEGRGTSPDSLDTIAAGTPADADLFCEFHSEAGPRGVFAIYPDWGDDVDSDVRDKLGPDLARRIAAATGLPVRGGGIMSERATAVGAGGDRLGVFRATADRRAGLTRLILEVGSHTDPADLAIIRGPGFYDKAAKAFAEGVAAFYGVEVKAATPPAAPNPAAWHCTDGGRDLWVLDPILAYWKAEGGLPVFGYPVTPQLAEGFVEGDVIALQYFQRARLEIHKDGTITRGLVGAELAHALHLPGAE